jgi:hypothetical protein
MSTDCSFTTILSAINNLEAKVASLTSGLNAAEERITRIERATFTPSSGFILSSLQPNEDHDVESTKLLEVPEKAKNDDTFTCIEPSDPCSSEIRRQLKPVNNTLIAVTAQLSRIEYAVSFLAPKHNECSDDSESRPDKFSPQKEPIITPYEDKPTNTSPRDPQSKTQKTKNPKFRYSFVPSPQQSSRPVFGHPSTPSRRIVSLDVADSPFGNYSDEKSPFSQLPKLGHHFSGVFHDETPKLPIKFQGLSADSGSGFGASQPTKKG